ncbi:MAG TPA: response regulator [bacterium]|nr:response regulator [bacterium]
MNPLTSLIGRLPTSVPCVLPSHYTAGADVQIWNLGSAQEIHLARMPESPVEIASALGPDKLFLSGDGRNFHQLRVSLAAPQALLTATPRFIPMAFTAESSGMRLLCNLPDDSERLVDLVASHWRPGHFLQDAAFYLFSEDEETPALEGALRRWWAGNVEETSPGRETVDAAAFTAFVRGLGHIVNNANAVIASHAEYLMARENADEGLLAIRSASHRITRLIHRLQQRFHGDAVVIPDPLTVLKEYEVLEEILREWAVEAAKPAAPVPAMSSPAVSTSLLVIEDDEDLGDIQVLSLETRGFPDVRLARTPTEAMRIFDANPALTAVLSDYNLQADRTGLDLAREMRRKRPGVKILIATGEADNVKALMSEDECNEIEILRKPTDEDDLEDRLRRLLGLKS